MNRLWAPAFGRAASSHAYVFEYYFPVSSWMIRRESYHRMLSRVAGVDGSTRPPTKVKPTASTHSITSPKAPLTTTNIRPH